MSPLQEAAAWLPDWIPLTGFSTGTSVSSENIQQFNNNDLLDTTRIFPCGRQTLVDQPHMIDISEQTENFNLNLSVTNTPLQPDGHRLNSQGVSTQPDSRNSEEPNEFRKALSKTITVSPSPERMVNRKLTGIHIFVC